MLVEALVADVPEPTVRETAGLSEYERGRRVGQRDLVDSLKSLLEPDESEV
jgi:hypothetical protein